MSSTEADGDQDVHVGSPSTNAAFVPFLSHLTDGASVKDLDPSSCLPLNLIRGRCDNAVFRLMSILNGDNANGSSEVLLTGMVSGPPTSIVVPLVGELSYLVDEYISENFDCPNEAEQFKSKHQQWYGVVDGVQVHAAITKLRHKYPLKWGSVSWKVFCVRPGFPLDDYRKLAVVHNERNKHIYHFEPTLYEMLRSLRTIHDKMYQEQLKKSRVGARGVTILHRDVAIQYDGGKHERNTTVRQAVSVASRLSVETIEAIGKVANMVCADIILSNSDLNAYKLTSRASVLSSYDCRLFKKFLCTSTLRGAKSFMNAIKDDEEQAQVNTIHRARHWCETNNYRSIKPTVLNAQYQPARLALDEECKFLQLINFEDWPENMETTRENLLRTTAFDVELSANAGNTTDILPKIWSSFKRTHPSIALGIEKDRIAEQGASRDASEETEQPPCPPDEPTGDDNNESEEESRRLAEEEEKKKEEVRRANLRSAADLYLSASGIATYGLSFDDFSRDVWSTSSSKRVDLVLSAVPSSVNPTLVKELPSFCKSVLKTGCYVFLLLSEAQFSEFQTVFLEQDFKVCDYGFSIHYDNSTIRRRRSVDFPQRNSEIALIGKTRGQHPNGFVPDFLNGLDSGDEQANITPFDSFVGVEFCSNKLKRPRYNTPLFHDERSVDLFSRIIRMLTPPEGSCLDPFGGPLTTCLASLKTGRSCIAMDDTGDVFKFAVGRLRVYSTPSATMEMLDDYTDTYEEQEDCEQEADEPFPAERNPLSKRQKRVCAQPILKTTQPDQPTSPEETWSPQPSTPIETSAPPPLSPSESTPLQAPTPATTSTTAGELLSQDLPPSQDFNDDNEQQTVNVAKRIDAAAPELQPDEDEIEGVKALLSIQQH